MVLPLVLEAAAEEEEEEAGALVVVVVVVVVVVFDGDTLNPDCGESGIIWNATN
jgi:hypothetical protein